MLYVTHHTEEILPIFTHSLLIRRGEIFEQGVTEEVFNSELLSQFFEMSVNLDWNRERAWLSRK
ncbi:putative ABC transporter ATP-binding protein YlmA [compost metagenome]